MSIKTNTFESVPLSVTNAFGDLSRFEEQLRDEWGVGVLADPSMPLVQHRKVMSDPRWHESLRDEKTGLYLPATLAAQYIARGAGFNALAEGLGISQANGEMATIQVESLQLPADNLGHFIVKAAFNNEDDLDKRAANTNAHETFQSFLDRYDLGVEAKTRRGGLQRAKRVSANDPPYTFIDIRDDSSMHADTGTVYPDRVELVGLASTSHPTLMPVGSIRQGYSMFTRHNDTVGNSSGHHGWVDSSLREVAPPDKIGLITGDTLHTQSFGKHADAYVDSTKGYAERVFTGLDARIEK